MNNPLNQFLYRLWFEHVNHCWLDRVGWGLAGLGLLVDNIAVLWSLWLVR